MVDVRAGLERLGLQLPTVSAPLAAYVPATRVGSLVFTAGQLPLVDGVPTAVGLVADDPGPGEVSIDVAYACALRAGLNAIAAAGTVIDVDRIVRVVKVTGFVAGVPDFVAMPQVVNGASELFGSLWEDGHARSAVGVAALPLGVPVEIEAVFEIGD